MNSILNRLDEIEETVLDELKDFQRATVERIDHLYRNGQNRILVSDEVGLGKTLVARGTIAKFAKLRREEGDNLVKVVYICSNATIAETIWLSLRAEARSPTLMNMAAIKKNTMTEPHSPTPTIPPFETVTII